MFFVLFVQEFARVSQRSGVETKRQDRGGYISNRDEGSALDHAISRNMTGI
jgi:hypothetical protein